MKKIFLVVLNLLIPLLLFTEEDKISGFNKLKDAIQMKQGEKVIVIFQQIGSCKKCYYIPTYAINCAFEKCKYQNGKYPGNVKVIAAVDCSREKELKLFTDQYSWKDYILRDNGKIKSELGLRTECYLAVVDYSGKVLYSVDDYETEQKEMCKSIYQSIKSP